MEKLVIGILAHVDAGKTTLSEGILYLTGKIRKLGRVDHGEDTAGSGLCHPCNQWSGWCAGTYHDLMETSDKIPDPDVPVYQ